jgi:peptide/nickel transport system permease protein
MLSGSASSYAEKAPWIALFPGIAISLAVFGFNLFGDSLRDALDPMLRRGVTAQNPIFFFISWSIQIRA